MSGRGAAASHSSPLLVFSTLALTCTLAFLIRLFAVIRFESVIHEFDPYFNYRTTKYLTANGYDQFHNWFDDRAWYPLGRIIGGTIYPGLMATSTVIYNVLHALNITLHIREVCVFLAPLFSSFTVLVTFFLTKEITDETGPALTAAALFAIVPGYISRSVAGSYDNEAIAIFCMLLTFWFWLRAVKRGSVAWAAACSLAYFYMVSSWGGYVFLVNLIPLHVLLLLLTDRFTHRAYVAYSTFYALGTLLSMQIPFVGFQPAQTTEHMGALGVFGLCQLVAFTSFLRSKMSTHAYNYLFRSVISLTGAVALLAFVLAIVFQKIAPWTGRFYSFLDPSYAKKYIPIIASVSEHQPCAWSSFFFDLHILLFTFPAGLFHCFRRLTDASIFLILYGVTSIYFTAVMVRLMLVLSPAACILGGIAISSLLSSFFPNLDFSSSSSAPLSTNAKKREKEQRLNAYPYKSEIATVTVFVVVGLLFAYTFHCLWVTSMAYSSPSIVLEGGKVGDRRVIFDDFREAYFWLSQNTQEDAKVMSWWDYGYQISAMANRTVIVDNNTWNNTHISRVGQAMASNETAAYEILRELDVDYVLVVFGGLLGYSSDDINKFLWMIRIGGSTPEGAHIREKDYFTGEGDYSVDKRAPRTLFESLMYKMSYYRFGGIVTMHSQPTGFDRVRGVEIGEKDIILDHLEEAYTTEHWLVRIYRVKKPANRYSPF